MKVVANLLGIKTPASKRKGMLIHVNDNPHFFAATRSYLGSLGIHAVTFPTVSPTLPLGGSSRKARGGPVSIVRMCVAGDNKIILTTPAAWAAVLKTKTFQPKPTGLYSIMLMFVCPLCPGILVLLLIVSLDGCCWCSMSAAFS